MREAGRNPPSCMPGSGVSFPELLALNRSGSVLGLPGFHGLFFGSLLGCRVMSNS